MKVELNEGAVSLFVVYHFIKRLATPFKNWEAYKTGVIDDKGNILIKAKDRHKIAERQSFTKMDLLVLKLKRILGKLPGGKTRLASYAAALYLLKEDWKSKTYEEIENVELAKEFMELFEHVRESTEQELKEEIAANATGANIAGGGYQGKDDVKVSRKAQKKYKEKAKAGRKGSFINFEEFCEIQDQEAEESFIAQFEPEYSEKKREISNKIRKKLKLKLKPKLDWKKDRNLGAAT